MAMTDDQRAQLAWLAQGQIQWVQPGAFQLQPPSPPLTKGDTALVVGEPLVGWRVWRVCDDGRLVSCNGVQWPAHAALESVCKQGKNHAPSFDCTCGVYAYTQRGGANHHRTTLFTTETIAIGSVALWGRVIQHRLGYRAQYAYPVCVEAPEHLVGVIHAQYGCGVTWTAPRPREHSDDTVTFSAIISALHNWRNP